MAVVLVFGGSMVAGVSKPKTLLALVSFDPWLCCDGYHVDRAVTVVAPLPCHHHRAILPAGVAPLSFSLSLSFSLLVLGRSWVRITAVACAGVALPTGLYAIRRPLSLP